MAKGVLHLMTRDAVVEGSEGVVVVDGSGEDELNRGTGGRGRLDEGKEEVEDDEGTEVDPAVVEVIDG